MRLFVVSYTPSPDFVGSSLSEGAFNLYAEISPINYNLNICNIKKLPKGSFLLSIIIIVFLVVVFVLIVFVLVVAILVVTVFIVFVLIVFIVVVVH